MQERPARISPSRPAPSKKHRKVFLPRPLSSSLGRFASALACCAAIVAGTARSGAATYYWDSDSTAGNTTSDGPGSWLNQAAVHFNTSPTTGGSEVAATAADTVIFGVGGVGGPVTLGGAISIAKLEFGPTTTTGYTLSTTSAQILTLGVGGIQMDAGAQAATVGNLTLTLALGAAQTFLNNSASLLTVGGPITNSGNFLLTLNAAFTGGITLAGNITGASSGGITVVSSGTGFVTLSGANNYTGATTVQQGTLIAGSAAAFGNSATDIILGNATTISSNFSPTLLTGGAITLGRKITVGFNNTLTAGIYTIGGNTANASTFSGALTLNQSLNVTQVAGGTLNLTAPITSQGGTRTLTFNNAGTVNVSGIIQSLSGSFSVVQIGPGTTVLSGDNDNAVTPFGYTGGTKISGGTLSVGIRQNLGSSSSPVTFDGGTLRITGTAITNFTSSFLHPVSFTLNKTVGLDINGATNTFTVDSTLNLGSGGITKLGAGTLVLGTNSANPSNNYNGPTTISAGTLSVFSSANLGTASANLVFDGGTLQIGTLSTLVNFSGMGHAVSFTLDKTVGLDIVDSGTTFTVDLPLNHGIGGLTKLGLGKVLLNSPHTYTGTTTVAAGTLLFGANNVFTGIPVGPVTVTGGVLDIAATNQNVGAVTITGGTIVGLGGTLTGTSYSVLASATPITATLAGVGALTKTGAGAAELAGANSYTGGTTLSAGVLAITNPGNLGGAASGLVFDGGTLKLATGSPITSFTGSVPGTALGHTVTFNAGKTVGLEIVDAGTTFTADKILDQTTGGFTKDGTGTVILNRANTYSGTTSVKLGTLKAGIASVADVSGAFGNNSAVIMTNANATLDLNGFSTQIGSLTGGGSSGGNVILGSATLTVGGDDTSPAAYGGVISGANGSLVKIGTGTLTLSGSNTYTGSTTINGGKLLLDYVLSSPGFPVPLLSPSAPLNLGTGTLQLDVASPGFSHAVDETVASTSLTGVANITRPDPSSLVVLHMGTINRAPGASINFAVGGTPGTNFIARTNTLNTNGIIGFWATVDGTSFAVNLDNMPDGRIVAFTGYTPASTLTRKNSGTQVIPNTSDNVLVIEGSGTVANLTLAAPVTTINTLNQSAAGGLVTIDMAGGTLALNGILMGTTAGGLTIGTSVGNGIIRTPAAGGELTLQTLSANTLTVNSSIANNGGSSLTISGTGSVVLAASNNNYTGATTLSGGTLKLTGSLTGGTAITVSAAGVLSEAATGVISGTASITHSSSGNSFLFGANTYTGKTIITGGAIAISAENGLGSNPATSFIADQLTLDGGALLSTATFALNNPNRGINFGISGGTFGATIADTLTIPAGNVIAGNGGLTLIDFGALSLTGANTYSGPTVINGGSLIINSAAALGSATSKIFVNGTNNRGTGGGSLVLAGNFGTGVSLSRDIDIMGLGPISDLGAPLISVRNNTLSGTISRSALNGNSTRVYSAGGLLQFTGKLDLTGTAVSQFITFGAINAAGMSNFAVTGTLSGIGSLQKINAGTLILDPALSSGFSGTIRVSSGSTVRIVKNGVLGTRTGPLAANIGVNSVLDMNSGTLEVRMDAPLITAGGSPALVYGQLGSTFFVDHAPSGSAISGTATFGTFTTQAGQTYTVNGRNGYGVTFADTPINGNSSVVFTNNLNGLLTLDGTAWSTVDATSRTMTVQGNGDSLITGYILASGADHFLTKAGSGTLTLTAASAGNSTFTGATNIISGTLATVNIVKLLNQGSIVTTGGNHAINIGATTVAALSYVGAGETTPVVINLASSGIILANQSGAPLIFTSSVAASGAATKSLFLGGSANGGIVNQIQGVIQDNAAGNKTSLFKSGPATWLYAPAPGSFGAGAVTTTGATLGAANSNIITVASTTGITIGERVTAGGTNVPVGAVVTNINGNQVTLSSNIGTSIANGTSITFGAATGFTGNITIVGGILQAKPTAATGNGSVLFSSGQVLTFAADTATFGNQWAGGIFQLATPSATLSSALVQPLGALTPTAGASKVQVDSGTGGFANTLSFASLGTIGAGATVDLAPNASLASITFTAAPAIANGVIGNGHVFFNGGNFAKVTGTAASVALYTPFAGGASLATNNTLPYDITGNVTAQLNATIRGGLRVATGPRTLTLSSVSGGQTLTLNNGLTTASSGILVTGGSIFTVSGGIGITSGGAPDIVIRTNALNDTMNLSTPVTSTTTGGITKVGLGTLVLNSANAETGTLTINEGTVRLGIAGAQLGGNNLRLTIRQNGMLDLNGINPTNTLDALVGSGIIQNSIAPVTLTIGANNTGGLFSGIIGDSGTAAKLSIIKAGNGTEAFTGLNTFSGTLQINAGTVQVTTLANIGIASGIGRGDAANNAASLVFNGGILQYTGDTTTGNNIAQATGTPSVSVDRLFTLAGNGTIDSSGTFGNAIALGRTANNAAIVFSNTGPVAFTGTGARTLTLTGDSSGDNRLGIQLIDNGGSPLSVIKSGNGLWVLGNAGNTYTGLTTVSAGTLRVGNGASLPNASNLVIDGGIVESAGTFTRTIGAGAGAVNWRNGGFAAAGTKLVVNLTGSTPTWNSSANFVLGSMTLNSATALAEVDIQSGFAISPGIAKNISVTTTAGSATVDLTNGTTVDLAIGQLFTGNGNIPGAATIASILSSTQFTLSTGTGVTAAVGISTNAQAGGYREIIVNDNTNTNTDVATISGIISGSGTLRKSGAGILQLLGLSTYAGQTQATTGVLTVNTLGLSTAAATGTSVGISTSADTFGRAIVLGNGGTGPATLQYIGTGEKSDRMIGLFTTSGSDQIHADGSGPLILTNVTNDPAFIGAGVTAAGAKTLFLRGSNAQANQITSDLTNNGGALSITVDGAATWVLGGQSTYTGATTINTGALGVGSSSTSSTTGPLGGGTLNLTAGIFFAYGADRSIENSITGAGFTFVGDYSLSFTGTYTTASVGMTTTNNIGQNNLLPGKILSLGNMTFTAPAAGTWTITGVGNTVVTGAITGALNLAFNPTAATGTLALSGVNTYNGATILQNGTTILTGGSNNHLPATTKLTMGNGANSAILQLGDANGASNVTITSPSSVTLNGQGQVTASSNGPVVTIAGTGTKNAIIGGSTTISSFAVYVNSVFQPFSTTEQPATIPSNLLLGTSNAANGPIGNEANIRLVKVGPGTLEVSGTRYYTGGTDIGTSNGVDGGILGVNSNFYLGGGGGAPSLLNVYGGKAELGTTNQTITNLNLGGGAAGSTALVNIGGQLFVTGDITYNSLAATSPNPATIGGSGSLIFQPSANLFTIITVGKSAAGSGVGAPDLTLSSALGSTNDIHKEGPGTLRMVPNVNTSWSGNVILNGGTLVLDGTAAANAGGYQILAPAKSLAVNSGTTLNLGATEGDVLSLSTVTVQASSRLIFNLGAPNPSDVLTNPLAVATSDVLNLLGGVLVLDSSTNNGKKVDISKLATGFASGISTGNPVHYTLLSASQIQDSGGSAIVPTNNTFTLGTAPGGFQYTLHFDPVASGGDLILDVGVLPPGFFWKGGIDSKWSSHGPVTSNWVDAQTGGVAVDGFPGIGNNVIFSADSPVSSPTRQATTTVDIDMGVSLLTINDVAVATINGANGTVLTLGAGLLINATAGTVTFGGLANANPLLDQRLFIGVLNSQSWQNDGAGTLTVLNQVFSAATSGVQTITFTGSKDTTISGNVIDGGLGGAVQLLQASTSTLTLTNPANSYSGGTVIAAGTVAFASDALPVGGSVTFSDNGTLKWSGVNTNDVSSRLKIANGKTGTLDVGNNTVTFASQIQAGPANLTTGILNKTGSGKLVMAAPYVDGGYQGGTNITQGTLEFASGAFFPYNTFDTPKANITFTGNSILRWSTGNTEDVSDRLRIANGVNGTLDTNGNNVIFSLATIQDVTVVTSTGSLTKDGLGTLTLATTQKTDGTPGIANYSGGTTIFDGTLEFVSSSLPASVSGSLPAAGPIIFSNTSVASTATLRWITNAANPNNTYDISGRLQIKGGVTGTLDTNGNNVTFNTPMGSTNSPGFQLSPGTMTKAGLGTLTLAVANPNFTGATNIAAGTVEFVAGALPGLGAVTFTGSTTLRWLPSNTDDISARLTIPAGITGTVDTNANPVDFNFAMPASSGDLVKTGSGTLAFNAASNSNFTGGTNIASGMVIVTAGGLSGTKSVSVAQGTTFALQGSSTNRVNDAAAITMGAGSSGTPATMQINQFSEAMGVFSLAGNSVIDFGTVHNNAQLKLANSAAASWTGSLSIFNWTGDPVGGGADQLFFGSDAGGLTSAQLSAISFFSDAGTSFLGNATFAVGGEVVPVPEPTGLVALFSGAGVLLALRRRRGTR